MYLKSEGGAAKSRIFGLFSFFSELAGFPFTRFLPVDALRRPPPVAPAFDGEVDSFVFFMLCFVWV